jgi:ABC-type nitrate/sulfonate/bicarbonate transport system ATPase subunit
VVTPTAGAALLVRNVRKTFRGADGLPVPVLDDVSLEVGAGELVSLIGPSGCGKSTFLRLVAGLDAPSAGELRLGGEPITGSGAERGLVFQDPSLFPWLTVRRNIQAGLVARGVLRWHRHEVEELIRLSGLEEFADVYPHQLSGGMAQRAALARALANHPRLLLLDEPLGALDQFTRMRMQDELLRLWQVRGTTMMLVTHDIDESIYMSDRIAVVSPRPGRVARVFTVPLPRPRLRNDRRFIDFRASILEWLDLTGRAHDELAPPGRDPVDRLDK